MPGANQIAELLEGLRGEAEFESTGRFTLDFQQALKKIEGLSQSYPARWLLFGVQAAVALRATTMEVSLSHQRCSLVFQPRPEGEWLQLLESPHLLTGASSNCGRATTLLSSCLLWARALQPRLLEVSLRSPERSWLLEFEAEGVRVGKAERPGPAQLCVHIDFPDKSLTRTVELSQQLSQRLCFCPVPVVQEGRSLNSGVFPHLDNLSGWYVRWVLSESSGQSRLAALHPLCFPTRVLGLAGQTRQHPDPEVVPVVAQWDVLAPGSARLRDQAASMLLVEWVQQGQVRQIGLETDYRPVYLPPSWGQQLVECRAFFHRGRQTHSQLWIVQDGLALEPVQLTSEFAGWSVALASQSLKTDLTGLRLIEDEHRQAMVEWVEGHLRAIHVQQYQAFLRGK